jgi:hypothetical protein
VGRSDPPLRAVEELLRRRAQLSRDLDTERDELRAILEILMVLRAVTPSSPGRVLEILCLLRQLSRVVLTVAAARCRYIPGDANVDDVDGLAVRVGSDDVGHAALSLLHVGAGCVVPILHLPADVLEVTLPKERDEQITDRVVGRGTMPTVLCACALVMVAVLVAAWDAVVVLTAGAVAGSVLQPVLQLCMHTHSSTKFSTYRAEKPLSHFAE